MKKTKKTKPTKKKTTKKTIKKAAKKLVAKATKKAGAKKIVTAAKKAVAKNAVVKKIAAPVKAAVKKTAKFSETLAESLQEGAQLLKSKKGPSRNALTGEGLKIAGQVAQEVAKNLKQPRLKKIGEIAEKVGQAITTATGELAQAQAPTGAQTQKPENAPAQ